MMQRLLTLFLLLLFGIAGQSLADTVLVLPFHNGSASSNLNWIGESLAESVRESMAEEGVMVLGREDRVEAYRRLTLRPEAFLTRASIIKLARALDAEKIVYGQFNFTPAPPGGKTRGALSVTAHLLDLRNLKEGPELTEVGPLEDLARLQSHLSWEALKLVSPESVPNEAEFRRRHPPIRVDALENYIRGLIASNPDDKQKFFLQAVHLDSGFSQSCFQLGLLYWRKKDYKSAAQWLEKVATSDVHYRQASFFLGLSRYYAGDFAGAQSAFQIVAEAVPLNEVYNDLGAAESRRNLPQALADFNRALDGDPSDPDYHFNIGYFLWKQGNFKPAADRFRAVLERDPDDSEAAAFLDRCLKQSGPRTGESQTTGRERLKTNYEESAYEQLKAVLHPKKS